MVKLTQLKAYDLKDVDPRIIKEIENLSSEITHAISPVCAGHDSNVVLAALGWVHAVIIKQLISDDPEELEKAAICYATCLMNDIERLKDIK